MQQRIYLSKRRQFAILSILPCVVILFLITIFPLIYSLNISFRSYYLPRPGEIPFVGLKNYSKVLLDSRFWSSLKQTSILMGGAVGIEFFFGLGIALLFFGEVKGKRIFMPIILLPMMMTSVIVGYVWILLYNVQAGPLNYILGFLGLDLCKWISSPSTALFSIIIADIWQWTPFVALVLLAGLTALPQDIFEAVEIDGASSWQRLIYVTLPMLKEVIAIILIMRVLDTFRMFDKIFVMTRGGPASVTETVSFYAYCVGFKYFRIGNSSAMSFLLLIITVVICALLAKILAK